MTRVLIAVLITIGIELLIWSSRSTHLSYPIVSMGYPSFANYDYQPSFLRYELIVAGFPVGVCVFYLILDWVGPFASRQLWERTSHVPLMVPESELEVRRERFAPGDVWRLLVPLALVGISVRSRVPDPAAFASGLRLFCVVIYVGAAAVGTILLHRTGRARTTGWTTPDCFYLVSAVLEAVATFAGLWFVSHRAGVRFESGRLHSWPWIPWWFSVLGVALSFWWLARRLAAGTPPAAVERLIRVVLVGSALVYLLTAAMPGPVRHFIGYDDAQSLTGATLLQHGYFPWRDFQVIHGPFVDIFEALIGFALFQHSVWGQSAALSLVLVPLTYVCFYLLAAWATRCRSVLMAAPVLLFVSGILLPFDPRLFPLPLILILLGQTLRSSRQRWTVGLTVAMVGAVLLIPETVFQAVPIAIVVVLSDLVHRTPGDNLLKILRRTRVMIVTGVATLALWFGFLAAEGAAGAFVQWYQIFIPGHVATGAIPPSVGPPYTTLFSAIVVVVIVSLLAAAWRVYRQRPWTPLQWAGLAAALNAGIYGEQALMRPDAPHYLLSIEVGLTLLIIAGAAVIPAIDRHHGLVVATDPQSATGVWSRIEPLGLSCLAAMLLFIPAILPAIEHAPSRTARALGRLLPNSPFGYATRTAMEPGLYSDLKKILKTYVPRGDAFYDMTAAPGWYYFLLHQRPVSQLTNITQADTSSLVPSKLIIAGLERTRPPLIAFADWIIGLPVYDTLLTEVRDYVVSQYVLDHYTPVFDSHSILFLARNDLVAHLAPLPRLSEPPIRHGLYNVLGPCAWGDSANYLPSPPIGPSTTVMAAQTFTERTVTVTARTYTGSAAGAALGRIVVVVGGRAMLTLHAMTAPPRITGSPQVATPRFARYSGTGVVASQGPVSVYGVGRDGRLHGLAYNGQLPAPITAVRMADGTVMKVGTASGGLLDSMWISPVLRLTSFPLPARVSLKSVRLVTFHSRRSFGTTSLSLGDSPVFSGTLGSPDITANTLPLSGRRLRVRVGACLQWHGYTHRTLYVQQPPTAPRVSALTLSGVANVS